MIWDYIIVGQGLAGTVLAHTFIKENKKIFIIDEPALSSCSRVSAGNYNPVVFKRLVKSWRADDIIPFADEFYKEAQIFLKTEFFWEKKIVKIFSEAQERVFWEKKANENAGKYLSTNILNEFHNDVIDNPSGAGVVTGAGNLYVEKFIDQFRTLFVLQKKLLEEKFDFNALTFSTLPANHFHKLNTKEYRNISAFTEESNEKNIVHYKNISAKKIIFCEGWKAIKNPLFSYLPFKPAKGEALVVRIKKLPRTDKIIHKNISLFHIGDDLFFCGSTYEWNELNDHPTDKGKQEIIEKLKKLITVPFEVVEHKAGVRPSVKDRRPLIGLHPKNNCVGIFNGLGTKGVMLAPYFAKQFFYFMEKKTPLDDEVNIERFNPILLRG